MKTLKTLVLIFKYANYFYAEVVINLLDKDIKREINGKEEWSIDCVVILQTT